MSSQERLDPMFFGPPEALLYGCAHQPSPGTERSVGVVLCYPFGHEYIRSHRAFRVLAQRLARNGCAVLRFDWTGCGDSQGDADAFSLEAGVRNLQVATEELRRRSRVDRVCVVGRRLGATVALLSTGSGRAPGALVLWDPVVDGPGYLAQLGQAHRDYVTTLHGTASRPMMEPEELDADADGGAELLGQRFSSRLRRELSALDLTRQAPVEVPPLLLVESGSRAVSGPLVETLSQRGAVESCHLPDPPAWQTGELLLQTVPSDIVGEIVRWVGGDP